LFPAGDVAVPEASQPDGHPLQQHPLQIQAVDCIALHHLHDTGREVGADVAQPTGDVRRGTPESTGPFRAAATLTARRGRIVERAQTRVHLLVVAVEVDAGTVRIVWFAGAENHPPSPQALTLVNARRTYMEPGPVIDRVIDPVDLVVAHRPAPSSSAMV
jgi:hypothetical protein